MHQGKETLSLAFPISLDKKKTLKLNPSVSGHTLFERIMSFELYILVSI